MCKEADIVQPKKLHQHSCGNQAQASLPQSVHQEEARQI